MNKKQLLSIALLLSVATSQVNARLAQPTTHDAHRAIEWVNGWEQQGQDLILSEINAEEAAKKAAEEAAKQTGRLAGVVSFVKSKTPVLPSLRTAGVATAAGLTAYEVANYLTAKAGLTGKKATAVNLAAAAVTVAGLQYADLIAKAAALNPYAIGAATALSTVPMMYRNGVFGAVKNGTLKAASWMSNNPGKTALAIGGLAATGGLGWYFGVAPKVAAFVAANASNLSLPSMATVKSYMTLRNAGVAAVGLGCIGYAGYKLLGKTAEIDAAAEHAKMVAEELRRAAERNNNAAPVAMTWEQARPYFEFSPNPKPNAEFARLTPAQQQAAREAVNANKQMWS